MASSTVKTATLAAIPTASVITATKLKLGVRRNDRQARRISCRATVNDSRR